MSKKLTFKQTLCQSCTIDSHKGFVAPRALRVNSPGNQFLTCATFTCDQHRAVCRCHLHNPLIQTFHFPTVTKQALKAVTFIHFPVQVNLIDQYRARFQSFLNLLYNFAVVERLGEIIRRTIFHCFHGIIYRGISRDQYDRQLRLTIPYGLQDLKSTFAWHLQVCNEEFKAILVESL